jgi:hypothetical protein
MIVTMFANPQGENILLLNSASRMGNKIIMLELDSGNIEILDRSDTDFRQVRYRF